MIRKRLKSLVIYAFLAVAVGIIGFYMYKSVMDTNKLFIELDEQEDTVATVVPLDNVNYTIEGKNIVGELLFRAKNWRGTQRITGLQAICIRLTKWLKRL